MTINARRETKTVLNIEGITFVYFHEKKKLVISNKNLESRNESIHFRCEKELQDFLELAMKVREVYLEERGSSANE